MPDGTEPVSVDEIVQLGAEDPEFYCRHFFPKVVRQATPAFHLDMWDVLEDPNNALCNFQVFRGGAKTTLLRLFASRRIAYSISRTILLIAKSEAASLRTLRWIKRQVDFNTAWAGAFGLKQGSKWSDREIEIVHEVSGVTVWITACGITGSIRGINFDDYRPDLILVDDVIDDENAGTDEQRQKINKLLLGAVKQSLAPPSENPDATMAMAHTPQHKEDASCQALNDPAWKSIRYGCFDEDGYSRWEARYPVEALLKEKSEYAARNQLSIWYREKECRLIDPETSAFMANWLQFYDVEPVGGVTVLVLDPVPPPSERQLAVGLRQKDYEAFAIVRKFGNKYYVLETSSRRGHDPSWTIAEFFRLVIKWRPREAIVEATAYQRTL
ncbi:MAG: hypothetical protein ACRD2L_24310, partial [Terriglobia bacterium]